jgi:hypothetical protein
MDINPFLKEGAWVRYVNPNKKPKGFYRIA